MATNNLNQIAGDLQQLSRDELEKLFLIIRKILYPNLAGDLKENELAAPLICPYCSSTDVIRFGFSNKHQRYRCKDCKRTFGSYTLYRRFTEGVVRRGGSLAPGTY